MESDQAQKQKISLHPYRNEVSKIHVSSGSSFVTQQQQRKIEKSAMAKC